MSNEHHSIPVGLTQSDESLLFERVIGVVERDRERVEEHGGRFFERNAVLPLVPRRFAPIPLVDHRFILLRRSETRSLHGPVARCRRLMPVLPWEPSTLMLPRGPLVAINRSRSFFSTAASQLAMSSNFEPGGRVWSLRRPGPGGMPSPVPFRKVVVLVRRPARQARDPGRERGSLWTPLRNDSEDAALTLESWPTRQGSSPHNLGRL